MTLTDCTLPLMPADVEDLYMQAFPEEERRLWNPRPEGLRLQIARDSADSFLGFITTWQLPGDITYVEHLAVSPALRGLGTGGRIIDMLPARVILEVELPETEEARRRIAFYERHGFRTVPEQPYLQPPYARHLPSVPMLLMVRGEFDVAQTARNLHRIVYGA